MRSLSTHFGDWIIFLEGHCNESTREYDSKVSLRCISPGTANLSSTYPSSAAPAVVQQFGPFHPASPAVWGWCHSQPRVSSGSTSQNTTCPLKCCYLCSGLLHLSPLSSVVIRYRYSKRRMSRNQVDWQNLSESREDPTYAQWNAGIWNHCIRNFIQDMRRSDYANPTYARFTI